MFKTAHLNNCHFDLINFLTRLVSIKSEDQGDFSLADLAELIEPKLLDLATKSLIHPDELLFCKSVIRTVKIPGIETLSEDPENIHSVYVLIGMYVAAILDEKNAFPEVISRPLEGTDLDLLNDELSAIKKEINKTAEDQINTIEKDYELLREAIMMNIERKSKERNHEDSNLC